MLHALYTAYDRRRRPLREHHYMVFPDAGLAYARVPGDPVRAMSPLISRLAECTVGTSTSNLKQVTRDVWNGDTELLTARELKRRHPDFFVFAVVQSPIERVASTYRSVIEEKGDLPTYFRLNQFTKDMSIGEFVSQLSAHGDMGADNLLRSQSAILSYRSALVPDLIIDLESLLRNPDGLLKPLAHHSRHRLDLGDMTFPAQDANGEHLTILRRQPHRDQIRQRYQNDYRLFFKENESSPAAPGKRMQPIDLIAPQG